MPSLLHSLHDYDQMERPIEILDATASYRAWWKGKDTSKTLFCDKRINVKPDILCQNDFLPLIPDYLRMVFYDPPHVIAHSGHSSFFRTEFGIRFWAWDTRQDFVINVIRVNTEFNRVLRPDGVLLLKHTDIGGHDGLSIQAMLHLLSNFREIERVRQKSGTGHGDRPVYYIFLVKKSCPLGKEEMLNTLPIKLDEMMNHDRETQA
jgi:hypothetical protein